MRRAEGDCAPAAGDGAGRVAEGGGAFVGAVRTLVGTGVEVGTAVPVKDGSGKGVGATKGIAVGAANWLHAVAAITKSIKPANRTRPNIFNNPSMERVAGHAPLDPRLDGFSASSDS